VKKSKIVGKRFSRVEQWELESKDIFRAGKSVTLGQSTKGKLEFLRDEGMAVMSKLVNGNDCPLNKTERLSIRADIDSELYLAKRLYHYASLALNEDNSVETRIGFAVDAGMEYQKLKTYTIESNINRKNKAQSESRCESLEEYVIECIKNGLNYNKIWLGLEHSPRCDYDYYIDDDQLHFCSHYEKLKSISKKHFIKKKITKIKQESLNPPTP
jgi:hypothetical protein